MAKAGAQSELNKLKTFGVSCFELTKPNKSKLKLLINKTQQACVHKSQKNQKTNQKKKM